MTVIGLFDLLGAARTVAVDPRWLGSGPQVYLFVAFIYFLFCYAVARQPTAGGVVARSRGR